MIQNRFSNTILIVSLICLASNAITYTNHTSGLIPLNPQAYVNDLLFVSGYSALNLSSNEYISQTSYCAHSMAIIQSKQEIWCLGNPFGLYQLSPDFTKVVKQYQIFATSLSASGKYLVLYSSTGATQVFDTEYEVFFCNKTIASNLQTGQIWYGNGGLFYLANFGISFLHCNDTTPIQGNAFSRATSLVGLNDSTVLIAQFYTNPQVFFWDLTNQIYTGQVSNNYIVPLNDNQLFGIDKYYEASKLDIYVVDSQCTFQKVDSVLLGFNFSTYDNSFRSLNNQGLVYIDLLLAGFYYNITSRQIWTDTTFNLPVTFSNGSSLNYSVAGYFYDTPSGEISFKSAVGYGTNADPTQNGTYYILNYTGTYCYLQQFEASNSTFKTFNLKNCTIDPDYGVGTIFYIGFAPNGTAVVVYGAGNNYYIVSENSMVTIQNNYNFPVTLKSVNWTSENLYLGGGYSMGNNFYLLTYNFRNNSGTTNDLYTQMMTSLQGSYGLFYSPFTDGFQVINLDSLNQVKAYNISYNNIDGCIALGINEQSPWEFEGVACFDQVGDLNLISFASESQVLMSYDSGVAALILISNNSFLASTHSFQSPSYTFWNYTIYEVTW